jgi:hypothetical protein
MFKKLLITFLGIAFFLITSSLFAGDKAPLFQSKTDTECIRESGVNMSWCESFTTKNFIHYVNREVEHALITHKWEKIIFIIKGLEEVYIICGQEYPDKTQTWQLFEVDIYDNGDSFTQLYREMLRELIALNPEPEKKCIIKND